MHMQHDFNSRGKAIINHKYAKETGYVRVSALAIYDSLRISTLYKFYKTSSIAYYKNV